MATPSQPQALSSADSKILWTRLALFVSVIGVVGSLYLSLQLGLKACPLCFYQRAFMMAVAAILGLGLSMPAVPTAALAPLALASTIAGSGIAAFHTYLDATGVLECPAGISGTLTAPQESLAVYALLLVLLLCDLFNQRRYVMQGIGAILLGVIFTITCIQATPPSPAPAGPYTIPLDGCRKPYHPRTP